MRGLVLSFSVLVLAQSLISCQLSLPFTSDSGRTQVQHDNFSDAERDSRTGEQWLLSVLHYAKFNMGTPWLKVHRSADRFHPVRQHWLAVFHTVNELMRAPQRECACVYCQGAPFVGEAVPINYVPRKEPLSSHLPVARLRARAVRA